MQFDILSTEDLYEDEYVVLIKRIGNVFNSKVCTIDIGIKDKYGDIESITTLKTMTINED